MRSKGFYLLAVIAVFVAFSSWVLYPTGSPGGKTGSPGDGGANCTQCHTGTPQQATGWITSNIPAEGYVPGTTYTVTASGVHNGVVKFGFEATAEASLGAKTGSITVTNTAQTKLVNGNKSITHTSAGTTPFGNTKSWSFNWTAPAEGAGPVTFYAAFNAANGNGSTTGDVIYLSSTAYDENTGVGIADNRVEEASVSLSPNPATSYSDITWNEKLHSVSYIKVYSLTGSKVASYKMSNDQAGRYRISTEDLKPGMYFVQSLFADGQQSSRALIIQD